MNLRVQMGVSLNKPTTDFVPLKNLKLQGTYGSFQKVFIYKTASHVEPRLKGPHY